MAIVRTFQDVIGRHTHGNPVTLPAGTLTIGENWETTRDNCYRKVRGRQAYGSDLPAQNINQFLEYKDSLITHMANNTLYYDSDGSGTFVQYQDVDAGTTFTAPESNYKVQGLEYAGNYYITTSIGIQKIDSLTANFKQAGVPKGLSFDTRIIDSTNWLDDGNTVSYRILWSYTDANNNKIVGAPSERQDISNSAGGSRAVELRIYIPNEITTDYLLEIYRSSQIAGTPTEDYQLVYQAYPTSAEITNGYILVDDILPDGFKGASLYTNTTQEGIENANDVPPKATSITQYKEFVIYGNVETKQKLFTSLISTTGLTAGTSTITINDGTNSLTLGVVAESTDLGTGISNCADNGSGLIRVTTTGAHGATTGEYVNIYDVVGTTEANGIWEITVINATNFDLVGSTFANAYTSGGTADIYEDIGATPRFILYSSGTDAQNIDNTARSFVRCLTLASGNSYWYAYYDSNFNDPVGKIRIEAINYGATAFYLIVNSTATGNNFSPSIPTSGTTYISTNDDYQNAIMVSKSGEGEAVPAKNIFFVGTKDDPILRVVGLRDSLIIIKQNDGVFRLTGDSLINFNIDEFDGTVTCTQRNSIAKGENSIFMASDSGYVRISDVGVEIIGRANEFKDLNARFTSGFEQDGYGWFYETEKSYFITTHEDTDSTTNDTVKVYNTITNAWTERKYGVYTNDTNISVARVVDDIMYTAPLTGNSILQERKALTTADMLSPDVSITISAIDTDNNIITISSGVTVPSGSIIKQGTNERSIVTVNSTTSYELASVNNLTTGAATILVGIESTLKYQQIHAGMPEADKQFQKVTIYFDNDETSVQNISVLTTTELDTTEIETFLNESNTNAWAGTWDGVWGAKTETTKFLTLVPEEHSRGSYLYIKVKHLRPREYCVVTGYTVEYEVVDTRTQR